jgi:hypothetical protein
VLLLRVLLVVSSSDQQPLLHALRTLQLLLLLMAQLTRAKPSHLLQLLLKVKPLHGQLCCPFLCCPAAAQHLTCQVRQILQAALLLRVSQQGY